MRHWPKKLTINSGFLYFTGHTFIPYSTPTQNSFYSQNTNPVHSTFTGFDGVIQAYNLGTLNYYLPTTTGTSGQYLTRSTGTTTTWSTLIRPRNAPSQTSKYISAYDSTTGIFSFATASFAQVNADWSSTSGVSKILNKPHLANTFTVVTSKWVNHYDSTTGLFSATQPLYSDISGLATVAHSGSYSDLSSTPVLPVTKLAPSHQWFNSYTSTTGIFTSTQPTWSDIASKPTFATVATSGSFSDLTGTSNIAYQYSNNNLISNHNEFDFVNGYNTGSNVSINFRGSTVPITSYNFYDGNGNISALGTNSIQLNFTEYIGIRQDQSSVYGVEIGGSFLPRAAGSNGQFIQTTNGSYGITAWSSYSLPTSIGSADQVMTSNGINAVWKTQPNPTFITIYTEYPNTITWDMSANKNVITILSVSGGNPTLAITNVNNGDVGCMEIIQCSSGGKQLVFPSNSIFKDKGTKVISTEVNSVNIISFVYDGTYFLWNIGINYTQWKNC